MASREATTVKTLKYIFSEKEQVDNSQCLASKVIERSEAEQTRKQVVANLKADEDRITADISKYSRFVKDGYDQRPIECKILFDSPKAGLKTIVRLDTGEEVETLAMETHERQMSLDLQKKQDERENAGSPDGEYEGDEEDADGSHRPY